MSTFIGTLKDFQEEGVQFALSNPYSINNYEPGLGKTITSLAVACAVGGRTLIIVPAFLRDNWKREIKRFTKDLDYDITSYSALKKLNPRDLSKYRMVICDEVHFLKNFNANRTEYMHNFLSEYKPKYFMGLSGTPISNRISEFWSLLQLCFYGGSYPEFQPFYRLYYKFCHTFSYERTFEINGVPIVRFEGVKNADKLKALIAPVMIRKKSGDVLDSKGITEIDLIGCSKKYDKQLQEAFELYEIDPNDPQYMSLKSMNALAKTSITIQYAKEFIEQGVRPLIFTCHRSSARELASKLGCKAITGEVPADKRQAIIDEFNSGTPTALVATIGSTAVGYNITSTNYTIFNDSDFVPANMEQARRRTDRMGQTKQCFYYYVYASEFDKKLSDMIARKSKDISRVYN